MNLRPFATRALAIATALLALATVVVISMQPDRHAEISGMPALLGGMTCLMLAALFVFSGSAYTRLGPEIEKSRHPILFWILTALFVIAGIRCLLLI